MSFSQYRSIQQTLVEFDLLSLDQDFISGENVEPSPRFLEDFAYNLENFNAFSTEGARSEIMIFPILREVQRDYIQHCQLWVQESLSVTSELSGTPDYVVATHSKHGKRVLGSPLLIMVEAKRDDFEHGWGQCLAQMVAAQVLNGTPNLPVYGIVTNAGTWRFGRLLQKEFWEDTRFFSIDDMPELFGALHFTFRAALATLTI